MKRKALAARKAQAFNLCRREIEGLAAAPRAYDRWASELGLATIHASFGDQPECVEILKRLLLVPSGETVTNLRLAPDWDNVRDDPAFQALLARSEKLRAALPFRRAAAKANPRACLAGADG